MKYLVGMYLIFIVATFFGTVGEFNRVACTPKQMKEISRLNMFGCILMWLLMIMLDPLFFFAKLVWWAIHVGVEKENEQD